MANQGKHQVGRGWGAMAWSQWCIKIGIWDENGWEMDGLKMGLDDDIERGSLFHSF